MSGSSTQPHIPFGFAQGRSVFGRNDKRGWVCTENRQHRLIILPAHAWLQRSRSLTRANPATVANEIESNQDEVVKGQHAGRGIRDGISRGRERGRHDAFGEGR